LNLKIRFILIIKKEIQFQRERKKERKRKKKHFCFLKIFFIYLFHLLNFL